MNNTVDLNDRRSFNFEIDNLKKKLDAKHVVMVSVNEDGTFGSMIDPEISDIDLCYAIDCLQARRRMRNET